MTAKGRAVSVAAKGTPAGRAVSVASRTRGRRSSGRQSAGSGRGGAGAVYAGRHAAPASPAPVPSPGQSPPPSPPGRSGSGSLSLSAASAVGGRTYHRLVIAEFIATIIIIGASPFLVPRTSQSSDAESEAKAAVRAVTLGGPLIRLTAACIVFFVLALLSTGPKTGKIAAAFGALVMLGALINATDMWTALGQMFTGAAAKKQGAGG